MSDRLLKESDVLKAIDKRVEKLSKDPVFIRKNGIIDIMGVKKHILAIPSADRPQEWIPVSERLPEKGEVVLITNGKGNVRCGQYRSEHDVRGGTHYWWWKGKTVETVIAWMPLPKPYREENEE